MTCNHENLEEILSTIGKYQGGGQRHICAGCAYLLGKKHKSSNVPFNPGAVNDLPESQAEPQRHKNAYEAYLLGYGK